jgi:hypothetical protein
MATTDAISHVSETEQEQHSRQQFLEDGETNF